MDFLQLTFYGLTSESAFALLREFGAPIDVRLPGLGGYDTVMGVVPERLAQRGVRGDALFVEGLGETWDVDLPFLEDGPLLGAPFPSIAFDRLQQACVDLARGVGCGEIACGSEAADVRESPLFHVVL